MVLTSPPGSLGHMCLICEAEMSLTSSYLGLLHGLLGSKKEYGEIRACCSLSRHLIPLRCFPHDGSKLHLSDVGIQHSEIIAGLILYQNMGNGSAVTPTHWQASFMLRPPESRCSFIYLATSACADEEDSSFTNSNPHVQKDPFTHTSSLQIIPAVNKQPTWVSE